MNTLFSCAVIASRIESMDGLTRIIESRVRTPRSETLDKIKKEANALKTKLNTLKCNIPTATTSEAK